MRRRRGQSQIDFAGVHAVCVLLRRGGPSPRSPMPAARSDYDVDAMWPHGQVMTAPTGRDGADGRSRASGRHQLGHERRDRARHGLSAVGGIRSPRLVRQSRRSDEACSEVLCSVSAWTHRVAATGRPGGHFRSSTHDAVARLSSAAFSFGRRGSTRGLWHRLHEAGRYAPARFPGFQP